MSSEYCKNIDKHPDDKQALKDLNKKLTEEGKRLSSMKEELKNKEQACESVKNRYITRVKETLIASNPEKYVREIDGKSIENWRMINKDSKILEQQFKGKIPSPEDARAAIMSFETLAPQKTPGKTSVHQPYKLLRESHGVSWPKSCDSSPKIGSTLTHDTSKDALCSPQRKKAAIDRNSTYIYQDDYELALGMQNSFETLPNSFDLDAFEGINNVTDVDIQPVTTTKILPDQQNTVAENVMDKNSEGLEANVGNIEENLSKAEDGGDSCRKPALDLHALAEAALAMLEED